MRRILLSLVSCFLFAPVLAQTSAYSKSAVDATARIRERAAQGTGAYELVASLTSEIGPRAAGSEGDRAAVAWALRKLTGLGFQNVRAQDVMVPQWVRGSISIDVTSPYPQSLIGVALGGSVGTAEEGIEGEVLEVKDLDALRALTREQVESRIVFINRRMERTRDGRGYGQAVSGRTDGAGVASQLGARAIVIRSIGTDNNRMGHTGTVRYPANVTKIPAVALSNPDADLLESQFTAGKPVTLRLRLTARELPPMRSANVIAELPGTANDGEIVLLGAHLDSWDLGTGALDDGAGVAIVVEAVRLIRELKLSPRRTLRVVLFANEEFGLSGANAYAAAIGPELEKHVLAMEADLGAGPVWRFDTRVPEAQLPQMQVIANALKPLGIERGSNTSDGGADIGPLRRLGVPVVGLGHDASAYFDHHHTLNDTLDKVDRKALDQSVAAYAVAAWLAASSTSTFGRLPPQPAPAR
jgi:carboxypeptidase Q